MCIMGFNGLNFVVLIFKELLLFMRFVCYWVYCNICIGCILDDIWFLKKNDDIIYILYDEIDF